MYVCMYIPATTPTANKISPAITPASCAGEASSTATTAASAMGQNPEPASARMLWCSSIRQHLSAACVSSMNQQHASAACVSSMRQQHASAYIRKRSHAVVQQHTSASVSIRQQHASAYVTPSPRMLARSSSGVSICTSVLANASKPSTCGAAARNTWRESRGRE